MTTIPSYLSDSAKVDSAAIKPLPQSRKIYVQGSRPDIRVPMREITVGDTPTDMGGEKNAPDSNYCDRCGTVLQEQNQVEFH